MTAYVPILSTDTCRLDGLAAAPDVAKARLMPLFDVVAPPRGRDLAAHLDALIGAIAVAFGGRPALIDAADAGGERGDDCARTPDGRVHLAYLLDTARARGLALVPVTGLRRPDAYQLAVADAASIDRRGLALRLQRPDLRDQGTHDTRTLDLRALETLDALGTRSEDVDLVLDFGGVTVGHLAAFERAGRAALASLTRDVTWRSVTIAAATQLPADARGVARGPRAVPRTDWLLWRALTVGALPTDLLTSSVPPGTPDAPLSRYAHAGALRFGDYGPLLYGPHPARADGTAEWVGYAHGGEWLVRDVVGDAARVDRLRADGPRPDLPHPAAPHPDGYWGSARRRAIRVHRDSSAAPADVLRPAPCSPPAAEGWPSGHGTAAELRRGTAERATGRAAAVTHHLTIAVEQLAPITEPVAPASVRAADGS